MKKNTTIKERIVEFIKNQGITKLNFCNNVGINKGNLSGKQMQSEIGGEQISRILEKYPKLNPNWLLLGKGSMLKDQEDTAEADKSEPKSIDQESPESYQQSDFLKAIMKFLSIIEQKEKDYNQLKEKYENSKEIIKELNTEIMELKRR